MILQDIVLYDYTECIEDKIAICVANMYYWHLGRLETKRVKKLNIKLESGMR